MVANKRTARKPHHKGVLYVAEGNFCMSFGSPCGGIFVPKTPPHCQCFCSHTMNIPNSIHSFFHLIQQGEIEIYNEFSLQHELGLYLRKSILKPTKVQFERNVSYFNLEKSKYHKKEMDLIIFDEDQKDKNMQCAIELKFPRNGQVPESMFNFCKDISFLEQLMSTGVQSAYFIAVVDDKLFYSGQTDGIYGFFRGDRQLTGTITKPTGRKDYEVHIQGVYNCSWQKVHNQMKYCLMQIENVNRRA